MITQQDVPSLRDYQDWTWKVFRRADGKEAGPREALAHATLGICGELGELEPYDANELLEAGDVLSYTCLAASAIGCDVSTWIPEEHLDQPELCVSTYAAAASIHPRDQLLRDAVRGALQLSELVKKHLYQSRELDQPRVEQCLQTVMCRVAAYLGAGGYSLRQVILANTIKLESRYPPQGEREAGGADDQQAGTEGAGAVRDG